MAWVNQLEKELSKFRVHVRVSGLQGNGFGVGMGFSVISCVLVRRWSVGCIVYQLGKQPNVQGVCVGEKDGVHSGLRALLGGVQVFKCG